METSSIMHDSFESGVKWKEQRKGGGKGNRMDKDRISESMLARVAVQIQAKFVGCPISHIYIYTYIYI